jgi:hypothetical protein
MGSLVLLRTRHCCPFNDFDPVFGKAVAVDKAGYIYVSDNTRIYKLAPDGSSAGVFAGSGKDAVTDGIGAPLQILTASPGCTSRVMVHCTQAVLMRMISIPCAEVTTTGIVTTLYRKTDPLLRFTRLVVDSKGNAFVGFIRTKNLQDHARWYAQRYLQEAQAV